jgi:hypothetical protein
MVAAHSSESSVYFYNVIRRHVSEHGKLHSRCCANLNPRVDLLLLSVIIIIIIIIIIMPLHLFVVPWTLF